ncbi:MAG: hypothetical protein GY926_19475 [bacterium]|nr:hypothetical protein [bacterium]
MRKRQKTKTYASSWPHDARVSVGMRTGGQIRICLEDYGVLQDTGHAFAYLSRARAKLLTQALGRMLEAEEGGSI